MTKQTSSDKASSIERYIDEGYSPLEEWLHSISHAIGAVLSLAGMALLIVMASVPAHFDPWKIASVTLYGICLITLYLVSTLYHSVRRPRLKFIFQQLDHCAIYLLIAGTYTPFVLVNMRDSVGWLLFTLVWALAGIGIGMKVLWPHRFELLRVSIYLLMGWLMVLFADDMVASLSPLGVTLLVAGGITYTVGVVFYAIRAIPFHHAIWHLFVIGGSICHYLAIYYAVVPYELNKGM
ncbi:PAQR family membrane homeostasis protein TrhA [Phytohalomonas tamaricis]|uniref:PAQR family membrane homeostasis protein TrhA n=1 Tax=Phytohalomonas tamaricis TaxID=2081032 RepID=UPI000D0BCD06|nr:hemolysin III family protein [Phytohalomonas tamaricis]